MSLHLSTFIVGRRVKDANFIQTHALPASAGNVTTTAIDIFQGRTAPTDRSNWPESVDIVVTVPALNATQLPDAATDTVVLVGGDTSSPATVISESFVITGAGGIGAVAKEIHFRLAPVPHRYVAAKVTTATSPGDQSGVSVECALGF